ncbi:MAG: hypothetical protein UF734_00840 [Clostridium sp.]|nr:hypothetical protein [Clostridium sp.]
MRLRYRWLTVFLLALCCGCQTHRAKAEVKEVTIYDVAAMVKEKQSFVVVLTQSMCSSCKDFKTMLSTWEPSQDTILYVVKLEEAAQQEGIVKELFPDFYATPGIYYLKKGAVSDRFSASDYRSCTEAFTAWIKKHE